MSPNPAGKKWVIAQSKISLVSGGSVRNAVWVSSQCDPTIVVICMRRNLSGEKPKGKTEKLNGARGSRDIEGKAARVAAKDLGNDRVLKESWNAEWSEF